MRHGGRITIDEGGKATVHRVVPGKTDKAAIAAAHGYDASAGRSYAAAHEFVETLGEDGAALRDAMLALPLDKRAELAGVADIKARGERLMAMTSRPAAPAKKEG